MFNSFLNDRKQAQVQEIERLKQRFIKDELLRKKSQEKLSKNYKKRVENFVIQMAEKPILTHDFVPPVVKIRDEDPSKFLGAPSIAVRSFKNEKDRIKENIQSYKEMRADYISGRFEFRKRNPSKEIQPMMRFTSKTNFERVANRLKVLMQNPNQDARALAKGAENLSDSFILELSKSPQATNKYLATHLLPDLNTKTHFKATYSLCLGIPDTIMDRNALTERKKIDRAMRKSEDGSAKNASYNIFKNRNSTDQTISEGHTTATKGLPPLRQQTMGVVRFEELEEKAKETEKQMIIDTVNPVDVSKKVLVKCNIIRPKREGIKTLPKGGGHLMMSEKNLKEVYQELYQK